MLNNPDESGSPPRYAPAERYKNRVSVHPHDRRLVVLQSRELRPCTAVNRQPYRVAHLYRHLCRQVHQQAARRKVHAATDVVLSRGLVVKLQAGRQRMPDVTPSIDGRAVHMTNPLYLCLRRCQPANHNPAPRKRFNHE